MLDEKADEPSSGPGALKSSSSRRLKVTLLADQCRALGPHWLWGSALRLAPHVKKHWLGPGMSVLAGGTELRRALRFLRAGPVSCPRAQRHGQAPSRSPAATRLAPSLGSRHVSPDAIGRSSPFSSLLFLGARVLVMYELFGEAANATYALYTCRVCSTR